MSKFFSILIRSFALLLLVYATNARAESPTWEELELRFTQISQDEKALVDQYDALKPEYKNPDIFVQGLNQLMSTLTKEQREALHQAKNLSREDRATLPEPVQKGLDQVQAFDAAVKPFHEAYDNHQMERIRFFSDYYLLAAEEMVKAAKQAGSTPARVKKMEETLAKVREQHTAFAEKLKENNASRDKGWLGPFWEQRRALLTLSGEAGAGLRTWGEVGTGIMRKLKSPLAAVKMMLASGPFLPKSVAAIPMRWPMIKHGGMGADAAMWSVGLNMKVEGKENLPANPGENSLPIVVGNHTTSAGMGFLDGATLTKLIGRNPVLVDGGLYKLPVVGGILGPMERENPNNIVVTGEPDPITEIMNRMKDGKMDALFAFPEGNTFEGNLYGLRPWQDGFTMVVMENLRRRKGLNVSLVTVTSPRHYRFWNDLYGNSEDPKDLISRVHTPIESSAMDLLMASGDPYRAARVSRQMMLNSLDSDNDERRRLGTPNFARLVELNETRLEKALNCKLVFGNVRGLNTPSVAVAEGGRP